jgi:orotidine-5'-phosphate decarboxylase
MSNAFSSRLADGVRRCRTPVLVGLDPRYESLPSGLTRGGDARDPAAVADAYKIFCRGVIDVVGPLVPAVKPQAAFFEEAGPAGMQALFDTITYARQAGLIVILDGKRNDIGTTARAYAHAYLGRESSWGADALTVSPYLGDDSLSPFVEVAGQRGAGIFVLVKTSNPGGTLFQNLQADGRPIYEHVAAHVENLASSTADGPDGFGCVGAVVGATFPEELARLRAAMPHAWFLVPGYGAQGGAARDVAAAFNSQGLGAIINNSRGILFAYQQAPYKSQFGADRWQAAVEAATRDMIAQLRAETPVGRL